jgi:hypothetical protein
MAIRFKFGGAVDDPTFDNLGAMAWWSLRLAFQDGQISIPDDPILIGQLSQRRYEYTSRGKMQIKLESKRAAAAERGELFLDRADALAMAWWARLLSVQEAVTAPRLQNAASQLETVGQSRITTPAEPSAPPVLDAEALGW